jgi:hypothetical protein
MEAIYFDNTTENIVDEWLRGTDSIDNGETKFRSQGKNSVDVNDSRNQQGIGYTKKVVAQPSLSDSALVKRIKRNQDGGIKHKSQVIEQHGIVEDDSELSRTSIQKVSSHAKKEPIVLPPKSNVNDVESKKEVIPNMEEGENRKRKRIKTRSKQKNIRRDRRSENHKPSHLVIGSKDYCGRPLTEVCKSILL